jgi:hypothetical protein
MSTTLLKLLSMQNIIPTQVFVLHKCHVYNRTLHIMKQTIILSNY